MFAGLTDAVDRGRSATNEDESRNVPVALENATDYAPRLVEPFAGAPDSFDGGTPMRRLVSLVALVAFAAMLAACSCCRSAGRCAPSTPSIGRDVRSIAPVPVVAGPCLDWPNYTPPGKPSASELLTQIRANANLWYGWSVSSVGHSNFCGATCQEGWGTLVWNEAYYCGQEMGQHRHLSPGDDHYDVGCDTLYTHVERALAHSLFTPQVPVNSGNWQLCLSELNHEDGPMVPPVSAPPCTPNGR